MLLSGEWQDLSATQNDRFGLMFKNMDEAVDCEGSVETAPHPVGDELDIISSPSQLSLHLALVLKLMQLLAKVFKLFWRCPIVLC